MTPTPHRLRELADAVALGKLNAASEEELFYALRACADLLEWRPIETAPRDGTMILVHGGVAHWRERHNHWESPSGWYTLTGFDYPGRPIQWEVTHWLPLPPPPGDGNGN